MPVWNSVPSVRFPTQLMANPGSMCWSQGFVGTSCLHVENRGRFYPLYTEQIVLMSLKSRIAWIFPFSNLRDRNIVTESNSRLVRSLNSRVRSDIEIRESWLYFHLCIYTKHKPRDLAVPWGGVKQICMQVKVGPTKVVSLILPHPIYTRPLHSPYSTPNTHPLHFIGLLVLER